MFEKIYRAAVVLLLAAILGIQAYAQFKPQPKPTEACVNAIQEAHTTATKVQIVLDKTFEQYESDVYKKADNINQQIFMVSEYNYIIQTNLIQLQLALIEYQTACQ